MDFYPAYQLTDILDMYARTFYALLNEGYRMQHRKYFMLAHIVTVPHMDNGPRKSFLKQLEWAGKSLSDILNPEAEESSSVEDIKRMLGN